MKYNPSIPQHMNLGNTIKPAQVEISNEEKLKLNQVVQFLLSERERLDSTEIAEIADTLSQRELSYVLSEIRQQSALAIKERLVKDPKPLDELISTLLYTLKIKKDTEGVQDVEMQGQQFPQELSSERIKDLNDMANSLVKNWYKSFSVEKYSENFDLKKGKIYLLGEKTLETISKLTNHFLQEYGWLPIEELEYLTKQVCLKVNTIINVYFGDKKESLVQNSELYLVLTQAFRDANGLEHIKRFPAKENGEKWKIAQIIPVYNENNRANKSSEENPNGQNAVYWKLRQYYEMSSKNPNIEYTLIFADDDSKGHLNKDGSPILDKNGNPKKSAIETIQAMVAEFTAKNPNPNVKIIYESLTELLKTEGGKKVMGGVDKKTAPKGQLVKGTANEHSTRFDLVRMIDFDLEVSAQQLGDADYLLATNSKLKMVVAGRNEEESNLMKELGGVRRGKVYIDWRKSITGNYDINDIQQTFVIRGSALKQAVNEMNTVYSNSPAFPLPLVENVIKQHGKDSLTTKSIQMNFDSSESSFNSASYVKMYTDPIYEMFDEKTRKQFADYKSTDGLSLTKVNSQNESSQKLAAKIIAVKIALWIEKNPDEFGRKMDAFANSEMDVSGFSSLNRKPWGKPKSFQQAQIEFANYLDPRILS